MCGGNSHPCRCWLWPSSWMDPHRPLLLMPISLMSSCTDCRWHMIGYPECIQPGNAKGRVRHGGRGPPNPSPLIPLHGVTFSHHPGCHHNSRISMLIGKQMLSLTWSEESLPFFPASTLELCLSLSLAPQILTLYIVILTIIQCFLFCEFSLHVSLQH